MLVNNRYVNTVVLYLQLGPAPAPAGKYHNVAAYWSCGIRPSSAPLRATEHADNSSIGQVATEPDDSAASIEETGLDIEMSLFAREFCEHFFQM